MNYIRDLHISPRKPESFTMHASITLHPPSLPPKAKQQPTHAKAATRSGSLQQAPGAIIISRAQPLRRAVLTGPRDAPPLEHCSFVHLDHPDNAWLDAFIKHTVSKVVDAHFATALKSPALSRLYCSPPTPEGARGVWADYDCDQGAIRRDAEAGVLRVHVWACPMAWGVHLTAVLH
jgi:hypothetical protein